jgi:hypothetical protein
MNFIEYPSLKKTQIIKKKKPKNIHNSRIKLQQQYYHQPKNKITTTISSAQIKIIRYSELVLLMFNFFFFKPTIRFERERECELQLESGTATARRLPPLLNLAADCSRYLILSVRSFSFALSLSLTLFLFLSIESSDFIFEFDCLITKVEVGR